MCPLPAGEGRDRDSGASPRRGRSTAFQESSSRFPGFDHEVQGVFQERVAGRIKSHTYVVREANRA
jgi:ornithine decarboxylase